MWERCSVNKAIDLIVNEYPEFVKDMPSEVVLLEDKSEYLNDLLEKNITDETFVSVENREEDFEHFVVYFHNVVNGSIEIGFRYEDYFVGYCMCTPDMPEYDEIHKCCGVACDYSVPAMEVRLINTIMNYEFPGRERDMWARVDNEETIRKLKLEELENKRSYISHLNESLRKTEDEIGKLEEYLNK